MWKEFFDAHFHPERYSLAQVMANRINFFLATLILNAFPLPQQEVGVRDAIRSYRRSRKRWLVNPDLSGGEDIVLPARSMHLRPASEWSAQNCVSRSY